MEKIQSRVQDVRTEDGCALVSSGSWTPSEMDSLNSPTHGTDSKRLIVFVSMEMDQGMELARRVQWQALNQNRSVLYITLVENMDQELAADRWLAALKAATHGSTLRVDTRVAVIGEWMQALRLAYRPGDVILCHAEQEARDRLLAYAACERGDRGPTGCASQPPQRVLPPGKDGTGLLDPTPALRAGYHFNPGRFYRF